MAAAILAAAFACCALATAIPAPAPAAATRICTKTQRARLLRKLAAFERTMPAARRAFFKAHHSKVARARFVRAQNAKLKALHRAVRNCRVKPTPAPATADLAVDVAVAPNPAYLYGRATYTVTISNVGADRVDGAIVRATNVDPVVTIESATPSLSGTTCSRTSGSFSCTLAPLDVGQRATISVVVQTMAPGTATGTVSADPRRDDADLSNNSSTAVLDVRWPQLPPPTPGPSCSPSLEPGPTPQFENEGRTDYNVHLHSNGELHGVMLFVDFPDAPGSESTQALYESMVPPASQWYRDVSYGRIGLDITPINAWVRMPKPSTSYIPIPFLYDPSYLRDAIAAADPVLDYSKYNVVYVIPSRHSSIQRGQTPVGPPGSGVPTNDGVEVRRAVYLGIGTRLPMTVAHETGHLFGLPDLYEESAGSAGSSTDLVGQWDPMSNPYPGEELLAWHRWKLGFLDPSQLRCKTTPGVLEETLAPLETVGGVKAVVVSVSASKAYVAEVRQQVGHDTVLCDHGVLLYTVDATVASLHGPIHVLGAHGTPNNGTCGPLSTYDVVPGEVSAYEDASLKLEVLARDESNYRIRITKK